MHLGVLRLLHQVQLPTLKQHREVVRNLRMHVREGVINAKQLPDDVRLQGARKPSHVVGQPIRVAVKVEAYVTISMP